MKTFKLKKSKLYSYVKEYSFLKSSYINCFDNKSYEKIFKQIDLFCDKIIKNNLTLRKIDEQYQKRFTNNYINFNGKNIFLSPYYNKIYSNFLGNQNSEVFDKKIKDELKDDAENTNKEIQPDNKEIQPDIKFKYVTKFASPNFNRVKVLIDIESININMFKLFSNFIKTNSISNYFIKTKNFINEKAFILKPSINLNKNLLPNLPSLQIGGYGKQKLTIIYNTKNFDEITFSNYIDFIRNYIDKIKINVIKYIYFNELLKIIKSNDILKSFHINRVNKNSNFFNKLQINKTEDFIQHTYKEFSLRELIELKKLIESLNLTSPFDYYKKVYSVLKPREIKILNYRFSKNPLTLENIGNKYGVTRERIRQIQKKALERLEDQNVLIKNFFKQIMYFTESNICITFDEMEKLKLPYYIFTAIEDVVDFQIVYPEYEICLLKKTDLVILLENFAENFENNFNDDTAKEFIEEAKFIAKNKGYYLTEKTIKDIIFSDYNKNDNQYFLKGLMKYQKYKIVLKQKFKSGIAIYDTKSLKKFRQDYFNIFNENINTITDRALSARLESICTIIGRGFYKLKTEENLTKLDEKLLNDIENYIDNSPYDIFLSNTIYHVFKKELLYYGVYNKYHLQGILKRHFKYKYTFTRDYIKKQGEDTTIQESIISYILKREDVVTKDDIYNEFPGVTEIVISFATTDERILNYFGKYIHIDNLDVNESDLSYIENLIKEIIIDNKIHHCATLFDIIKKNKPALLDKWKMNQQYDLFSFISHYFKNSYELQRPYFAKKGVKIESKEKRVRDYVYSHDDIKIQSITDFAKERRIYIDSILDMLNSFEDYIIIDKTHIQFCDNIKPITVFLLEKDIEKNLTDYDFIFIQDYLNLTQNNYIKENFTEWKLYSYLYKMSDKFVALASGREFRKALPVIAKKSADIEKIKSLIYDIEDDEEYYQMKFFI